jgi:hypothetical protein
MPQHYKVLQRQALPDKMVRMSSALLFGSKPNARGAPRPKAGARHERTLEAVGSTAKLGLAGV